MTFISKKLYDCKSEIVSAFSFLYDYYRFELIYYQGWGFATSHWSNGLVDIIISFNYGYNYPFTIYILKSKKPIFERDYELSSPIKLSNKNIYDEAGKWLKRVLPYFMLKYGIEPTHQINPPIESQKSFKRLIDNSVKLLGLKNSKAIHNKLSYLLFGNNFIVLHNFIIARNDFPFVLDAIETDIDCLRIKHNSLIVFVAETADRFSENDLYFVRPNGGYVAFVLLDQRCEAMYFPTSIVSPFMISHRKLIKRITSVLALASQDC